MDQRDTPTSLVDLHTHSTASDGLNAPAEVVRLAALAGIRYLALTDHDSTEGLSAALAAGQQSGVEVIPGIELGVDVPAGELHMLGYFIDRHRPALQERLDALRAGRQERAIRIVERLNAAGIGVTLDEVRAQAGAGAVSRAHVARVLIERGIARSMDDAFARFLGLGRPGYVPRPRLTAEDAIALIAEAGGVAVLAHPFTVADLEQTLPQLVRAGLRGIEVYYGAYSLPEQAQLGRYASRFGLIPTGGSDFHGPGEREGRDLGSLFVPVESVEQLRQAAGAPGAQTR